MTRTEADERAKRVELLWKKNGLWKKLKSHFHCCEGFVFVKEGDSLVVQNGVKWPPHDHATAVAIFDSHYTSESE